ncbi:MAG: DUF3866 family protein, partial [Dermatophilaceae bacterium]
MQWRAGRVTRQVRAWAGAVELEVRLESTADGASSDPERSSGAETRFGSDADRSSLPRAGSSADTGTGTDDVRALAYTAVTGAPQPGERVLLNASALLRGLGTGGLAFVVARVDVLPPDAPSEP